MNPNASSLEVVEVKDLADGDFTDALKGELTFLNICDNPGRTKDVILGVEAVIHCAAPSFADPTTPSLVVWKGAYDGTVHLIEQSLKAGIKKFIYTGTFMNLFGDNGKSAFGAELVGPSGKSQKTMFRLPNYLFKATQRNTLKRGLTKDRLEYDQTRGCLYEGR